MAGAELDAAAGTPSVLGAEVVVAGSTTGAVLTAGSGIIIDDAADDMDDDAEGSAALSITLVSAALEPWLLK